MCSRLTGVLGETRQGPLHLVEQATAVGKLTVLSSNQPIRIGPSYLVRLDLSRGVDLRRTHLMPLG